METPSSASAVDAEKGHGQIRNRLTITFRDLNVHVTASDAALGNTLLSVADPRQLPSLLGLNRQPQMV